MSRKFITAGSVIIDYIIPYGHETRPGIRRGGGAMYSAQGLRLWEDSVAVAAYSGKDFGGWYGSWLSENGIDSTGVVKKYVKTRQTNLIYNAEGTFSCIGRGDEEYVEHPSVIDRELIEPLIDSETVGVHILAAPEPEIVLPISDLCRQRGIRFGMEFEVARLYGRSDNHELFMELSSYTDYFSINLYEAKRLFPGVRDEKDALEELRSYGVPCYFRLGTDGAHRLQQQQHLRRVLGNLQRIQPGGMRVHRRRHRVGECRVRGTGPPPDAGAQVAVRQPGARIRSETSAIIGKTITIPAKRR